MPDLMRSFARWLLAMAACTAFNGVVQPLIADNAPFLPYFLGVSFVAYTPAGVRRRSASRTPRSC